MFCIVAGKRYRHTRVAVPESDFESYAYAFKLLFEYASKRLKVPPSELCLEQLDAPLIVSFLDHLETERGNGPSSRNIRLAAIKSFMHFMEYRVPAALEQIRRILAIPAKKFDTRLVRYLTRGTRGRPCDPRGTRGRPCDPA